MRYGILIILLSFCINLAAQQPDNYTFRHIDQTDGLLQNNVFGIRQDARGFIWILTPNGLQRYDGSRFINYQGVVTKAVNGMANGAELYTDNKKNEVWVLGGGKMEELDLSNNRFSNYDPEQVLKDSAFKFDTYTNEDNNQCLLGEKGVFFLSPGSNKISSFILNIHPLHLHESNIMATDSRYNQAWVVTPGGSLLLFDGNTKQVFSKTHNPTNHLLLSLLKAKHIATRFIMIDSRSDCWISTWRNLFYRFNHETGKLISYNLSTINKLGNNKKKEDRTLLINAMYEDSHGNIWIATENAGLLLYHEETDDFEDINVDEKNIQGIQYNFKIYCIIQDKEENIWLGTDKGISIFNPYRQYFKSIRHEENIPSLPKNEILSFIQTNTGNILVGTWGGGISVYDNQWKFKKNILFSNHYEYNMVWCFMQQDKNIWAGCQHGYIHIYNPVTQVIKTIHPSEMSGSTIHCMAKDTEGNIWFGLHNGKIVEWDKQQNKFYPYNDAVQNKMNDGAPVLKMFIDKQQHFWVSTTKGFKEFDPHKRIYTSMFLPDKNNPLSISAISCEGIEAYNDTTLLIGTIYGGLNFFNTNTKIFSHLTANDGLPSNNIYALKKDTAGYIWFTTDYNLYKFKPANKIFIRYNMEPGITNSSFNTDNFYALHDGTWLTATSTEIICFHPIVNIENKKNEKVEIAGLKIFDNAFFIDSFLNQNKPIQLNYKQNFFTVEFALLDFSNLQQTKYYYRLSNVNKDWVGAGTKMFASYTNLNPGKYIFSVKTENDMGVSQPTSFTIIISPPFWQTWWFRLLCILIIVFIVYGLVRRRIKSIRHEAEMKQKIAETEMMALRAQMNPHFIFNCLNSIDNLIQVDEKEKATLYLSKFAKLIRSILENAAKNVVPCWKDMETLKLYLELEELRWDKKFSYQLVIADEILNGDYKVPPLVIQPFAENAIHHGLLNKKEGDKKLTIHVSVINNHIHYLIEDNGVGRAKANSYKQLNKISHESMGMQITTDRINLFNQNNKNGYVKITDMVNEFQEPCGTKVAIELINQS
jgi:ligand-binding sensor domain-containing protein